MGYFSTEAEGKSYFRPIIDNLCVGDLRRFQSMPADDNIKKRPHLGRFKISSITVQIRKETTDETKKKFIDENGKMFRVAIRKASLRQSKPDGFDNWMTNPFLDVAP